MELEVRRREGSAKHVLVLGGEDVSQACVLDLKVRIGCCVLRMGGIGDVATREEHRNRGYSRRVLNNCLEFMAAEGYDLSMLIGIPDFYPKFGYATVFPEYRLQIPVENLEGLEAALRIREGQGSDREAFLGIHATTNATRSGTLVRDPQRWRWFRQGTEWETEVQCIVACEEGDRVVGYAVMDDDPKAVKVAEVAGLTAESYQALAAALRERAKTVGQQTITVYAPIDHPFAQLARRLGCEVYVGFPKDSVGMGRIINLATTLEKLLPELTRRLARGPAQGLSGRPLRSWSGKLGLRTDIGSAGLRCVQGQWSLQPEVRGGLALELPQWALLQLLMGYRTADEVVASGQGRVSGEPPEGLLDALFPPQWAHMWHTERF